MKDLVGIKIQFLILLLSQFLRIFFSLLRNGLVNFGWVFNGMDSNMRFTQSAPSYAKTNFLVHDIFIDIFQSSNILISSQNTKASIKRKACKGFLLIFVHFFLNIIFKAFF